MKNKRSLWENIKIEHVEEAIKKYIPISNHKKTYYYIIANNKMYPARKIRQMAYELANGIECDFSEMDGKGGKQAKSFFEKIVGFKERGYKCININEKIDEIIKFDYSDDLLEEIPINVIELYLENYKEDVKAKVVKTNRYARKRIVTYYVKRIANGICQLCEEKAPFIDKNGKPYLEIHHIVPLSCGGDDDIYNAVALCPNCHRKMHSLGLDEDVNKLLLKVKSR